MTQFWPYEERFEILTERPFLDLTETVWDHVIALTGAAVVKYGCAPGIKHFVLSTSTLLVFPQRVVLSCYGQSGAREAVRYLLDTLAPFDPTYALLERRLPIGPQRLLWDDIDTAPIDGLPPITGCTEAGIFHRWPFTSHVKPPTTLAVLMHGLDSAATLDETRTAVREIYPQLLFCGHTSEDGGFSFNAVGEGSFVSMHYTAGTYASIEASVTDWGAADTLLERLVHLCRPASVVPVWHGAIPGLSDTPHPTTGTTARS